MRGGGGVRNVKRTDGIKVRRRAECQSMVCLLEWLQLLNVLHLLLFCPSHPPSLLLMIDSPQKSSEAEEEE